MKTILSLSVAGLLSTFALPAMAAGAPARQRSIEVQAVKTKADVLPQVPMDFPDGVKMSRDVIYQVIPGYRPLILDVYVPASAGPHPLVVYIHGGAWRGGHTREGGAVANMPLVLSQLAAEGFTVASVEYRLSGEAKFPAAVQDVNAAVRFLQSKAADYKIDTSRMAFWGGSAGAHLSLLTAASCRTTKLDPAATPKGCPQAVVGWYGVFDMDRLVTNNEYAAKAAEEFLGCTMPCPKEPMALASPKTFIDRMMPPTLLIHGDADTVSPIEQSRIGEAALRAAGAPVAVKYIAGVNHGFVGPNVEATRKATNEAVNATFDFIHAKLDAPKK